MKRLAHIEWLKIRTNATFWVLAALHIGIVLLVVLSGKIVLHSLTIEGQNITNLVDPETIPIYQFPDIWHNITYVAAYLKFILAIYVIISVTNEITYGTLRQNIMNGLSRTDFVISKLYMILLLSGGSTLFLFVAIFTIGITSTPHLILHDFIQYSGFIPAYFLELSVYLIFAFLIALLIKRTGLALGLLVLYTIIIEPVIALRIRADWIKGLLPLKAINNLIHMPFGKYALREVQDHVAFNEIVIVLCYGILFLFLIQLLLRKRDL